MGRPRRRPMPPATVAGDPHWSVLLDDLPDHKVCPISNSPLHPPCLSGMLWVVLPHLLKAVFASGHWLSSVHTLALSVRLPASWFGDSEANVVYKVSLRDITYPCGNREALIWGNAVSSLSTNSSRQNLLARQGFPSAHSFRFAKHHSALTRKFLPAVGIFKAGDGVCPEFSRRGGECDASLPRARPRPDRH